MVPIFLAFGVSVFASILPLLGNVHGGRAIALKQMAELVVNEVPHVISAGVATYFGGAAVRDPMIIRNIGFSCYEKALVMQPFFVQEVRPRTTNTAVAPSHTSKVHPIETFIQVFKVNVDNVVWQFGAVEVSG